MRTEKFLLNNDGQLYAHLITVDDTSDPGYWLFSFPYNPELVRYIKENFLGARFDGETRTWRVPRSERNEYVYLLSMGWKDPLYSVEIEPKFEDKKRLLFEHQVQGVNFFLTRKRAMLAFEMGTGKTLTSITAIEWLKRYRDISWWWLVAPNGAQREWERQLDRWDASFKFEVVTTYESLKKYTNKLMPQGIIFDESVKIKTPSPNRSKWAFQICQRIREEDGYILLLSGAPAPRSPEDWWHQIECIRPGWLKEGNLRQFRKRYAVTATENYGYGDFEKVVEWREEELHRLARRIRPIVFVKHKVDCFDLPAKIYDIIEVEPSPEIRRVANVTVMTAPTALQGLEALRELSDGFRYQDGSVLEIESPKLTVVKDLLNFYNIDNGGPGRLVIYAAFIATVDKLMKFCEDEGWQTCRIDGRGSSKDILDMFESEEEKNIVIIANPACVHGITLSKTHALVYYSNNFNVDSRIQSEDRRDRPGMDVSRGTRIVDICHLPTDKYILDKLRRGISIQSITLDEVKKLYA